MAFVVGFWRRFRRFSLDILGVLLFALAILTLLGLVGLTKGYFVEFWTLFLSRWFGWGAYLIVLVLLAGAVACLQDHFKKVISLSAGRLFAWELIFFTVLALMSVLGGTSLARADAGQDGGIIGWGLAEGLRRILPAPVTVIALVVFIALLAIYGLNLTGWVIGRLNRWYLDALEKQQFAEAGAGLATAMESEPVQGASPSSSASPGKPVKTTPGKPARDPLASGKRNRKLPPLSILLNETTQKLNEENIHATASLIEQSLDEFGIPARVVGYRVGPTITQYAVEPGYIERLAADGSAIRQKIRVSQISVLQRDLTRALSAERLRIEAPVPGQSFVGIEVPNPKAEVVRLKPMLESPTFTKNPEPLLIALGKDVSGQPVVANLAKMPHLLIAGTTGSGKSVAIASIIFCLAMNNSPQDLKLILLDPKMVELIRFNGLPHILGKVETQTERIVGVLRWTLAEMDRRYRLLEEAHTREIEAYNRKKLQKNEETLPRIVMLIDELADLMMSMPDQTEHSIVRLAQMARATGIHLVVATQRPSTDIITGLIKANFPARISFSVASSIDSRVILDANGAETLLGKGDMLFLPPEAAAPVRAQGVYVADKEIENLISFWKEAEQEEPEPAPWESLLEEEASSGTDALVEEAIRIVTKTQRANTSFLQRRLRIGYPRAARLMDELEEMGIVGPSQGGSKDREVLVQPDDDDESDDDLQD